MSGISDADPGHRVQIVEQPNMYGLTVPVWCGGRISFHPVDDITRTVFYVEQNVTQDGVKFGMLTQEATQLEMRRIKDDGHLHDTPIWMVPTCMLRICNWSSQWAISELGSGAIQQGGSGKPVPLERLVQRAKFTIAVLGGRWCPACQNLLNALPVNKSLSILLLQLTGSFYGLSTGEEYALEVNPDVERPSNSGNYHVISFDRGRKFHQFLDEGVVSVPWLRLYDGEGCLVVSTNNPHQIIQNFIAWSNGLQAQMAQAYEKMSMSMPAGLRKLAMKFVDAPKRELSMIEQLAQSSVGVVDAAEGSPQQKGNNHSNAAIAVAAEVHTKVTSQSDVGLTAHTKNRTSSDVEPEVTGWATSPNDLALTPKVGSRQSTAAPTPNSQDSSSKSVLHSLNSSTLATPLGDMPYIGPDELPETSSAAAHTEVPEGDDLFWFLPASCQDLLYSKDFNFILLIMDCSDENTMNTLFSRLQDKKHTEGMQICVIEVSNSDEAAQVAAQTPSQGVFNLSGYSHIHTLQTPCKEARRIHQNLLQHIKTSDPNQKWDPEIDKMPSVVVLTGHGSYVSTPSFSSLVQHDGVIGINNCVKDYRKSINHPPQGVDSSDWHAFGQTQCKRFQEKIRSRTQELDQKDVRVNLETIKQEQRNLASSVISTATCQRLEMANSGMDTAVIDAVKGCLDQIIWDVGDKMQMFECKLNDFNEAIAKMNESNLILHRNLTRDAVRMERRNLVLHRTLTKDAPRFWAKKIRRKLTTEMSRYLRCRPRLEKKR